MKVICCGGRDYSDYEKVKAALDARKDKITQIVSGACRVKSPFDTGPLNNGYASGADGLGERWADENGIPYTRFYAEDYGKWPGCGPKRNSAMLKYADAIVSFPGGSGTADIVRKAKAMKMPGVEVE